TGDGEDDPDAVIHINVKNINKNLFSNTLPRSVHNGPTSTVVSKAPQRRQLDRQKATHGHEEDEIIPGYNLNIDLSPPSPLSSSDVSPESSVSPPTSSVTPSPRRALPPSPP
ncbi:hypothetical protein FHG87_009432, partial [Trinorchestia longiramus]